MTIVAFFEEGFKDREDRYNLRLGKSAVRGSMGVEIKQRSYGRLNIVGTDSETIC